MRVEVAVLLFLLLLPLLLLFLLLLSLLLLLPPLLQGGHFAFGRSIVQTLLLRLSEAATAAQAHLQSRNMCKHCKVPEIH